MAHPPADRKSSSLARIRPTISVVIPAMNEEKNLPHVFARIPKDVTEVILVDGRSVDRTVAVARELLPSVIVAHQTRTGKGNALACAFSICTSDIIVMIDADGSTDPEEIPRFVEALVSGADYAKGSRFLPGGGSADITRLRCWGNRALNGLVNGLVGTQFTDLCYGYNAFWRRGLPKLDMTDPGLPPLSASRMRWGDGFEIETIINIRAAVSGMRIAEVPSFECERIYGRSNLNAVTDGFRVLATILREYRRMRSTQPGNHRLDKTSHPRMGSAKTVPVGAISVVIPSYSERRLPQLRETVASALAQARAPSEVVVVIDHNEALHARALREFHNVTVLSNLFERGVSGNRNTGALHTRTPLVAFLDDDTVAQAGWLGRLIEPFSDPTVVGTGGGIIPRWATGRPFWFPDEFLWAVGGSYTGMPTVTAPIRNVWSANMAVRKEIFEEVGGFRLGFGKVGTQSRPEDTDLCLRMSAVSGGRWILVPEAIVDHPAEHTTMASFLRRCYQEGRGKVELARLNGGRGSLGSESHYLRRTLPRAVVRGMLDTLRGHGIVHAVRSGAVLAGVGAAAVGGVVESLGGQRGQRSDLAASATGVLP